jgi:ERCC4-related helicase
MAGFRTGLVFGGKEMRIKEQRQVLTNLSSGHLDVVIATSVLELGVSVPEVDFICNYSQPLTTAARIQRNGRTGRFRAGEVVSILINHPFDRSIYWKVRKQEKKMKLVLDGRMQTRPIPRTSLPLFDGLLS